MPSLTVQLTFENICIHIEAKCHIHDTERTFTNSAKVCSMCVFFFELRHELTFENICSSKRRCRLSALPSASARRRRCSWRIRLRWCILRESPHRALSFFFFELSHEQTFENICSSKRRCRLSAANFFRSQLVTQFTTCNHCSADF